MTGEHSSGGIISPPLLRAIELCQDGEWHEYDAVIREVGRVIPPGKALRRREQNRTQNAATHGHPDRTPDPVSIERAIETGRNAWARDYVKPPWFEVVPKGIRRRGEPRAVRLVQMPARLIKEQEMALRNNPVAMVELLVAADDDDEQLDDLLRNCSKPQLIKIVRALLTRLSVREMVWGTVGHQRGAM